MEASTLASAHAARIVEMQGQTQLGPARRQDQDHGMHLAGVGHARWYRTA